MRQSRATACGNFKKRAAFRCIAVVFCLFAPVSAGMSPLVSGTALAQTGSTTGLRIPRYVSLKSDRVNLREGPSKDHRTTWVFQRAGLPVEVTAEFENWRRIRDSEGSEGWVLQSLLSGKKTALVAPWRRGEMFALYGKPQDTADRVAKLQTGVLATVRKCDPVWCRISGEGYDGYIQKTLLWGVYPEDIFE
jgi:SH3-like domain-containing protein